MVPHDAYLSHDFRGNPAVLHYQNILNMAQQFKLFQNDEPSPSDFEDALDHTVVLMRKFIDEPHPEHFLKDVENDPLVSKVIDTYFLNPPIYTGTASERDLDQFREHFYNLLSFYFPGTMEDGSDERLILQTRPSFFSMN